MIIKNGLDILWIIKIWYILGNSPVMYSPAPRGECENCCPIRDAKDIKFLLYTR